MAERVTIMEAAARFRLSAWRLGELCRTSELKSARKERGASPGQACWWLDPEELRSFLRDNAVARAAPLLEPWSPRYRPAAPGEPTELQLEVLAGEWWHDLVNMDLRENGDLWTRWSDGERFLIRPDGEMDQFRYERVGEQYRQQERQSLMEESNGHHEHHGQLQPHAYPA